MRSGSVTVCAFAAEQIARPTSKANGLYIFFPFLKGEQAGIVASNKRVTASKKSGRNAIAGSDGDARRRLGRRRSMSAHGMHQVDGVGRHSAIELGEVRRVVAHAPQLCGGVNVLSSARRGVLRALLRGNQHRLDELEEWSQRSNPGLTIPLA